MNPTSQIDWIPVTERLPAVDREHRYLVGYSGGSVFMATRETSQFVEGREDWVDVVSYKDGNGKMTRYVLGGITHWAERPAVPRDVHLVEIPIGENCLLLCTEKAKES